MGQYISTGIVYYYLFEKSEVEREYERLCWKKKPFSELKQEIINQMFPEIYDFVEDKDYIMFCLSDSLRGGDFVSTIQTYYSLFGKTVDNNKDIKEMTDCLKGKTIKEAYEIAKNNTLYLFWEMIIGYNRGFYAYPLVIDGVRSFYKARASILMINSSPVKTITEDSLLSYDFFTELLRYRMKPDKLADSMLIFLTP